MTGASCCGSCARGGPCGVAGVPGPQERVEAVIMQYVRSLIATGKPWYISRELNSGSVGLSGMGFWQAIAAAVSAIGSTVVAAAPTVASLATTAATVESLTSGGKGGGGVDPNRVAAMTERVKAKLAAQGVSLPDQVVKRASMAAIFDVFGYENRFYVMGGAALLFALLVLRR